MNIYVKVYKNICEKKGVMGKALEILYEILLKFKDPIISYNINGYECKMNFSHKGAYFMEKNPLYDRQLSTICELLKNRIKRSLNIIDVGANIGDTVLNIGDKRNKYLCIEGVYEYISLLKQNLKDFDFELVEKFLDEKESDDKKIVTYNGTARIVQDIENKLSQKTVTLDSVCEEKKMQPDIIKIDTDGFDFRVLRGAKGTIRKYKPVLFFEWTLPELVENKENPISIFETMYEEGYKEAILMDNLGNPLCIVETSKANTLLGLIDYTKTQKIGYYDVCLIHCDSVLKVEEVWDNLLR